MKINKSTEKDQSMILELEGDRGWLDGVEVDDKQGTYRDCPVPTRKSR